MEKIVQNIRERRDKFFLCPNNEKIDEDFYKILQIFYAFGFYQTPNSSKSRIYYGIISFVGLILTYNLLMTFEAIKSARDGNFTNVLIASVLFLLSFPFVVQTVSFSMNQRKFVDMIKNLQSLHEHGNEETIKNLQKKCLKMLKFYLYYLLISLFGVLVLKLAGISAFTLLLPVLYDRLADIFLYPFVLFINFFHCIGNIFVTTICDCFPIFCMKRLEANLNLLNYDLRHCTDSLDQKENEKNLIACVRYHEAIMR